MLLRNECNIVETLSVNLYFDDMSEKHISVATKDIVRISYNNNGKLDVIEGKVSAIRNEKPVSTLPPNLCGGYTGIRGGVCHQNDESYLIVDGSNIYAGKIARIKFSCILDCDMIEKYDESMIVKTVADGGINRIKLLDGKLYLSQDNGETWVGSITLDKEEVTPDETPSTGTEEDTVKDETETE